MDTNTPAPQRSPLLDRARARLLLRATRGGARAVALELLELTNPATGTAETSATELATIIGCARRNVQQHVARLRSDGWLDVRRRGPSSAVYTWNREKLAEAWTSDGLRIVRHVDDAAATSSASKPLLSLGADPLWSSVLRAYEHARDTVHPDARGARLDSPRTDEDAAELVRVGRLLGEEVAAENEPLAEAVERELTRAFVVWMRQPQHQALRVRHHPLCFAAEDADRLLVYARRARRSAPTRLLLEGDELPRSNGFQQVLRAVGGAR